MSGSTVVIGQRGRKESIADNCVAYAQLGTLPCPFREPLDARNDDVGTQSANVTSERGDRAIRGDKQRQNIETFRARIRHELRVVARRSAHQRECGGAIPRMAVDQRDPVGAKRGMKPKKVGMDP